MGEHVREAVTPVGSLTEGEGGFLVADCSCGGTYAVPQGPDHITEGKVLAAAHLQHVAPFVQWDDLHDEIQRSRDLYAAKAREGEKIPGAASAWTSERAWGRSAMCDEFLAWMKCADDAETTP